MVWLWIEGLPERATVPAQRQRPFARLGCRHCTSVAFPWCRSRWGRLCRSAVKC